MATNWYWLSWAPQIGLALAGLAIEVLLGWWKRGRPGRLCVSMSCKPDSLLNGLAKAREQVGELQRTIGTTHLDDGPIENLIVTGGTVTFKGADPDGCLRWEGPPTITI